SSELTRMSRQQMAALVDVRGLDEVEQRELVAIGLRFLRTPSFLVRYVDLRQDDVASAVLDALDIRGDNLGARIARFAHYAASRIGDERANLLGALTSLGTGVRPT